MWWPTEDWPFTLILACNCNTCLFQRISGCDGPYFSGDLKELKSYSQFWVWGCLISEVLVPMIFQIIIPDGIFFQWYIIFMLAISCSRNQGPCIIIILPGLTINSTWLLFQSQIYLKPESLILIPEAASWRAECNGPLISFIFKTNYKAIDILQ
jgi:hypothetical protein